MSISTKRSTSIEASGDTQHIEGSGSTQNLVGLVYGALLGLALIALTILSVSQSFGQATVSAVMFSLAFFLLGGLLGFLFGIPRTFARLSSEGEEVDPQDDSQRFLETNSNLVQVSDWLTKILVGVALVQLGSLPGMLSSFGNYAETAFGNDAHLATASMLFFAIDGFLVGYLATRLILQNAFSRIERDLINQGERLRRDLASVQESLSSYQERQARRDEQDYEAITAVHSYLATERPPTKNETKDMCIALRDSSPHSRGIVFGLARDKRRVASANGNQILLRRTIDIFTVLLELDTNNYRLYAELGYAFKDSTPPRNDRSEQMLSTAIQLRGSEIPNRYAAYELNRAIVRIRLGWDREAIVDDLRKVSGIPQFKADIERNREINEWFTLNNLSAESL